MLIWSFATILPSLSMRFAIKTCSPDIKEFGNVIFQALSKIDPLNTLPPNILASTLTPFME